MSQFYLKKLIMIYETPIFASCNTYNLNTTLYYDTDTKEISLSGEACFETKELKFYTQIANKGTSGDSLRKQMNKFIVDNQAKCIDELDKNGEIYKTNIEPLTLKYTSLSHLEGMLTGYKTNREGGLFLRNTKNQFRKEFPFHGKKIKVAKQNNTVFISNEELKALYQAQKQIIKPKSKKITIPKFNGKTYKEKLIIKHDNYTKKLGLNNKYCVLSAILDKKQEKTSIASHILDQQYCKTNEAKSDPNNGLYLSASADSLIDSKQISFDLDSKTILVRQNEVELINKVLLLSKDDYQQLFHYLNEVSEVSFWQTRNAIMMRQNNYIELKN